MSAFDPAVLAAYLVSPGRGLLLFAPVAGLAVAALARGDEPRRLVRGSGLAGARGPDAGGLPRRSLGPTGLRAGPPLADRSAARGHGRGPSGPGRSLGIAGRLAHRVGPGAAVLDGGYGWDRRREPAAHPDAVWDLRDSPFGDLMHGPPPPDPALFLPSAFRMAPGDHPTRAGEDAPWLAFGWEPLEPTGAWASGRESWIVLAVPPGDYTLALTAAAPLIQGHGQRLEIERPGGPPLEVAFTGGLWSFERVRIPFRPQAGITVLKIRPAWTWRPGRGDVRRLGFFVSSLWLQHTPGLPGPRAAARARP